MHLLEQIVSEGRVYEMPPNQYSFVEGVSLEGVEVPLDIPAEPVLIVEKRRKSIKIVSGISGCLTGAKVNEEEPNPANPDGSRTLSREQ